MPAINKLTDSQCRKAEPRDKQYKLFDGHGLHLLVTPAGAKVWRQAYRRPADGKPDTLAHGPYPLVSLQAVREKRDQALLKLLDGQDPKAAAKLAPAAPQGQKNITTGEASDTYWNGKQDVTAGYRKNAKRGLERHLAVLWKRDIRTVTREELLDCLNAMNNAGKYDYVRKVRMWASQVWEWAVEQRYADSRIPDTINPRRAFGKKKVKHFASLHQRDFPDFWNRVHMEKDLISVFATKILAYTMVRTKEMRFMEWEEIDAFADLLAGRTQVLPDPAADWIWDIPEGKMKREEAHLVPLPRQARELLLQLWERRRRGSKYVFAAEHRDDRTISENTVLALIYRIGYKGLMTGHGFRSVASTWGNENGYKSDWIEMQLSHVDDNKVRGAYNRAQYLKGRRKLLQDLSDWIDSHLSKKAASGDVALLAA